MIEPWVDVQLDIDAINRGEGFVDTARARIWINHRLYGYHAESRSGTLYPIDGDGFVQLTQLQFFIFRKYIEYNGVNQRSEFELSRQPEVAETDREVARRIWRIRDAFGR